MIFNKVINLIARYRVAALSVAFLTPLAAIPAKAQDEGELEEIVVVGIRGSLERALDIKRESTGFVDAVSAEDVGKLPDYNVAEALQRVTGVAIQRSRGEGDFVSLRGLGPDFVRGSVNGRSLLSATEAVDPIFNGNLITSTGRATNFDVFPSEIINSLEVVKSPSASDIEGGIAGTVNLKTARPLSMGHKKVVSAQGTYRDFNEEFDPQFSGLVSWTNDDESFGVLTAVSYSERSIREDFSRNFGWFPSFGISTDLDTDDDGVGDASPNDVPFPLSNNAEVYEETRDRLTIMNTLQWTRGDSDITVDVLYSKREIEESHQNLIFLPIIFDGDLAGRVVNADGSVQVGDLVSDGTFFRFPTTLRPELTTDLQDVTDESLQLGVNFKHRVGAWELNTDLSYAIAEGESIFDRVRIDADNGSFAFDTLVSDAGYDITQTNQGSGPAADLGNPDNYVVSVLDDRAAVNEDEEFAIQFDAIRELNHDLVSSIEMGVRVRSRDKTIERASNGNGIPVVGAGVTVSDIGAFNPGAGNFLDGMWRSSFGYDSLIFPDNAATRSNSEIVSFVNASGFSTTVSPNPFESFGVEEDTIAGYAQVNLDGGFGDVGFAGDIGFRVVATQQDVNGFDAEFVITDNGGTDTTIFDSLSVGSATPVSFDSNYANVLPSMNLRFELADDLYLRTAYNKTMTRPTFESVAPAYSVNANASDNGGDNFAVALNAGNPALEPVESDNYDLGIEWYFGDSSAAYAGLFHKSIDGFVATVVNTGAFTDLAGQPIRATGIEMDGTRRPISVDIISQPDNQGIAEVTGVEIGIQQAFDFGFGYIANVTLLESSAEFEATGQNIDFDGVSDTSFNAAVFYETDVFQARLAYTDRSEFLRVASAIGSGGQVFNDSYSQLDLSVLYSVTENWAVFFSGVNLGDDDQDVFQVLPAGQRRFSSTSHVGPRYAIGVRGSF